MVGALLLEVLVKLGIFFAAWMLDTKLLLLVAKLETEATPAL